MIVSISLSRLNVDNVITEADGEDKIPHDRWVLLQCTAPLLWNHNSAVVLAAAGVHWLLAPNTQLKRIVKPLLFLMRSSYDTQYVVRARISFQESMR